MNRELSVIQSTVRSKYPNINYGGCGLFAYVYAKHFPESKLYLISYDSENKVRECITNGEFRDIFVTHVFIKHGDTYLDGANTYASLDNVKDEFSCWYKCSLPIELDHLEELVFNHTWNREFWGCDWSQDNANKWITRMNKTFDKALKQLQTV